MTDRRVIRSKTRAIVRRLAECRSCEEDETDTSTSDHNAASPPPGPARHGGARCRGGGGYCSDSAAYSHASQRLPPVGVFWDIENCQIPRGKSAVAVAQVIRDQFLTGYRETEFIVVCDVKRETPQVIQELDNAQVNVIHVGSQSKNAADEKLRQSIRRFADIHGAPSAIVLISGDINFAPDLCDLRNRKKIHVILVHNENCADALMVCANEKYSYNKLVADLPLRGVVKGVQQGELTVSGLPVHHDPGKVRARLKQLAANCGGRVGLLAGTLATLRFPSMEFAIRAQKRMDGEDVYGSRIVVSYPSIVNSRRPANDLSPSKGYQRRTYMNGARNEDRKITQFVDPRSLWKNIPPFSNNETSSNNSRFKQPYPVAPLFNQENVPSCFNLKFSEPSWDSSQNRQSPYGRPILGRPHGTSFSYEPRTNEGYSNGRHSLDSMLDFEVEREAHEREKLSNESFEIWLRNSRSNLESRKCRTPSPPTASVLELNTSIPPPPIVNLPRRNDSNYSFHPIEDYSLSNGQYQSQSSPSPASSADGGELSHCIVHGHGADCSLAKVTVRLSEFAARLVGLVTSHDNRLPLPSLKDCYEAQFQALPSDSRSVPLEHLVTCVCSVQLAATSSGKLLKLATSASPTFQEIACEGPLAQLSRELQDLLTQPPAAHCCLPLNQLLSAYRRRFGRPCRLADYGCTTIAQLLDKLPDVVQVMGEGSARVVTLTHRAQMLRFTADLTKVLRSQPNKQLTIPHLSKLWFNTLGRLLQPTEYGLCFLEDLLDLVPASHILLDGETVSLPRKLHQTEEQALRTTQFIPQVVELLSTAADFTMEFSKFCPAYHHHFGVQCKLSDYGFTKLAELFEAIPHIVKVEGEAEGGRRVSLTRPERLKVAAARVSALVPAQGLSLDALSCAYLWQYGHALRPAHFGCDSVLQLVNELADIKVVTSAEGVPIIISSVDETEESVNDQSNSCSAPKIDKEDGSIAVKAKTNGAVDILAPALLDLFKKAQQFSPAKNGVNNTELNNKLKPQESPVTLLSPAEFLRPPKQQPQTTQFPSSPDASALPRPVALTFAQVKTGFDIGSELLEDLDLNEQNRPGKQRLKLAPQFCSPLQLK